MSTDVPAAADIDAHRPLTGVRVVDMSRYLPGPFCSLQLGWLGAEVICIEQPPLGDSLRALPPLDDDGVSLAYRSLRRDVRVELLDLGDPAGAARALELVADADVVLESFRPGVAARLGLDARTLRRLHPGLVYCSLSGYGQDGPWAQAPGHDLNYQASAGLLEQNGTPDEPVPSAVPYADLAGGMAAATAICAALVRRAATGTGCSIDIALTEAALALQAMQLPGSSAASGSDRGSGMLSGGFASYRPYRCADGAWLALAPIEPKFFAQLCSLLERPDLIELQYDLAAQQQLRRELEAVFATRTSAAWEALLTGSDGGSACVNVAIHPSTVDRHPQLAARGVVRTLDGSGALIPGSPYVLDGVRSDDMP